MIAPPYDVIEPRRADASWPTATPSNAVLVELPETDLRAGLRPLPVAAAELLDELAAEGPRSSGIPSLRSTPTG